MDYAYQGILETFRDLAGKWRVTVSIADTEAILLKFDYDPTTKEVQDETAKYIVSLAQQKPNELEMINKQIEELQARKVILEAEIAEP